MVWYINDASLQGQFSDTAAFETALRELLDVRKRNPKLRSDLRTTRTLAHRPVTFGATLRNAIQASSNRDLKVETLIWLDRTGPFIEDTRLPEAEDYFEYLGLDVTDGGLGEAARRVKVGDTASTFSFGGGPINFAKSPLNVDHGLAEDRLGSYHIENIWTVEALSRAAVNTGPPILSWKALVLSARERFPRLIIPDSVYLNPALARESFDPVIRDRALVLLEYLDSYMAGRLADGAEGPAARDIINTFFVGGRALFTGESPTNLREFKDQLTFSDPEGGDEPIVAHWHGKISHRYFRMHFEWPVPAQAHRLKILYLGPKITRD